MIEVPSDCLFYSLFELEGWFPAEFILQLGRIDGISKIVPSAVGDESNEVEAVTFRVAEDTVYGADHHLDEVDVPPFVETSDVVGVAVLALVEDEVDGAGVILDIEPVTDILAFSIYRERLAFAYIIDKQRDELFRELVRAVVVGAVRDHDRHSVCIVE